VSGFHALGTLMAVGIMILPAASARLWARKLSTMLALAAGLALVGGVIGLLLSFHTNVPAGPAIILVCGLAYFISLLAAPGGLIAPRWPNQRHLKS